MKLRTPTPDDTAPIQGLISGVLCEYGLRPDPDNIDRDLADIEAAYFAQGGFFCVVEDATGQLVATLGIGRIDENTCELRKMYVAQRARGKGLGDALIRFAISKALAMGFSRMTLETATPLVEAVGLYRKHGFQAYHPPELCCRCDLAYELDLTQYIASDVPAHSPVLEMT